MKKLLSLTFATLIIGTSLTPAEPTPPQEKPQPETQAKKSPTVIMSTTHGDIHLQLDPKHAPLTVKNFLTYVKDGFYHDTIFHRVIDGFMIQGGGFKIEDQKLKKQPTKAPIKNESESTLANTRGTIAMARTNNPDSATSQFFINVVDNPGLNYPNNCGGYAVFGKVTKGLDVIDKIKKAKTGNKNGMQDVPLEPITIKSITLAK